jgi:RHS repeat-associated protein
MGRILRQPGKDPTLAEPARMGHPQIQNRAPRKRGPPGLTQTSAYNGLLQPCRMNVNSSGTLLSSCTASVPSGNLLDLTTGFSYGSADNGNVMSWAAAGQQSFNRSYSYDGVNRLSTMSAPGDTCSGLSWSYDQWGNRTAQTVTGGTCGSSQLTFNSSNRVTNTGFQYDAAGNMTHDASHSYTYDAENRITKVDGGSTATYVYGADGRRVSKTSSIGGRQYLYDLNGNVISEVDQNFAWQNIYLRLNGSLLAEYPFGSPPRFFHADHLGSTRLLTSYPTPSVVDSMDYLPFGEQIAGSTWTFDKFTGYARDSETGLDNAQARYNSSSLGRFMSPDPVGNFVADGTNPQTWNLYAYVNNNPLAFVDPTGTDGLDYYDCPGGGGGNDCGGFDWEGDFGWGTSYTMDGAPTSPSAAQSALSNFDAAVACPAGNCNSFIVGPTGQWYEEFTVPCPPGTVAACTGTGILPLPDQSMWQQPQPQPPIWWLQTKVFVSTLVSNFANEFTPQGCFAQFGNELATGQAENGPPGYGPEDVTRSGGEAAAGAYAASRALSYPLKSSVYRGVLGLTETAAGVLTVSSLDYVAGKAFVHEMQSLGAGTCR